jgi:hypothetical protein
MRAPLAPRDTHAAIETALNHCRQAQMHVETAAMAEEDRGNGSRCGQLLEVAGSLMGVRGRLERLRAA